MHLRRYQKHLITLNDKYENFINAHLEAAAAECIATKQRAKPRVPLDTLVVRKKTCQRKNCIPML